MNFTKSLFASACPAALLALPLALTAMPAFAQSTGTQDVETVVVTGARVNLNGLMNAAPVAKERSVVTSEYLNTQTSGQTVFQALNFMPGINFTNNDPYGSSGGNIRMHGQDGNHISLMLDGMPLNDTGNYAIYTNQMLDPEDIDRVSANQGATDVDSPTAAATGGTINISSDRPHDELGVLGSASIGQFNRQRYFARVDTGAFGPWNTKAFASVSYQDYNKFKGPGHLKKVQANLKILQDFGSVGWFTLAGHWNVNRNNSYYGMYYVPNTTGFASPGASAASADIINNPTGSGYVNNPLYTSTLYEGSGWNRDYKSTCAYTAPTSGVTDSTMTTCSQWYKTRINPSDTGNVRFHSLWHLLPSLTWTVDANLQYVLANGGGNYTLSETDARLKGSATSGSGTTTSAYGCILGVGCDVNGDGDIRDSVLVYSPSTTNTRRWGFNTSFIFELNDQNTFQLAYTLDYGLHRQTGQMSRMDPAFGPYSVWGGLNDAAHAIKTADGLYLRNRDRKSKAILNQVAFDWEGRYFDNSVMTSVGFRDPFLERDLNQYCYEQVYSTSSPQCTSQPMYQPASVPNAALQGYYYTITNPTASTTKYVAPGKKTLRFNRFLPHVGVTYLPFGKENQFFATYTQELAAPRTDNLYAGGLHDGYYGIWVDTKPETSTTYQLGYRYLGEDLQLAVTLWNSQVRNRIVSTYDLNSGTYFDHNIPGVNFTGVDFEANYQVIEGLNAYFNAGYDRARITTDIQVGGGLAATLNKQLSETPKWTFSGRVNYEVIKDLTLGLGAKYVGRRNMTEDNNLAVPDYYTFNLDVRWDLDSIGMDNS